MRVIGRGRRKQAIVMSANEATLLLALLGVPEIERKAPPAAEHSKTCLLCQRPHTHHNSFCSAECCREWRRMTKAQK